MSWRDALEVSDEYLSGSCTLPLIYKEPGRAIQYWNKWFTANGQVYLTALSLIAINIDYCVIALNADRSELQYIHVNTSAFKYKLIVTM